MAFSHRIPLVSAAAGTNNDGALIGSINESLYLGVFSDVKMASNTFLYRFEHLAGTSYDVSEYAVTNGVISGGGESGIASLFGTVAANITSLDVAIIACDNPITGIWVDITQAGAHPGTLEIHDSTDFARLRAIQSDGSNAFRNTGIREIALEAASDPTAWSPGGAMLGIVSRRWYRLRLSGVTAGQATAAPQISRIWIVHVDAGVTYLDLTVSANGDTAVAPTSNTFFPAADSSTYYCTANQAIGEERYVFTAQANNRTRIVEFLTPTGWQQGTVTDPSNDFTDVPSTSPEKYSVRWTAPATWTTLPPPFTLPAGAAAIATGFWRRIRSTAITTAGPMNSVSTRTRALQYGNINTAGIEVPVGTTLRQVTIEGVGSVVGSGATTLQLANLTTGVSTSFDIPEVPILPLNVDITDLALAANQRYGLFHVAGTTRLTDVALIFV